MIWRNLSWIDVRYEVSDTGLVRSSAQGPARLLKPNTSNSGYAQVRLPVAVGKFKWFAVHRLALQAFTGVVGEQCNHKNGNRLDNTIANLEWCTMSENMRHAYRALGRVRPGLGKTGTLCKNSRPVVQANMDGSVVRVWPAQADAERDGGFDAGLISLVCTGMRRSHAGFIWRHAV